MPCQTLWFDSKLLIEIRRSNWQRHTGIRHWIQSQGTLAEIRTLWFEYAKLISSVSGRLLREIQEQCAKLSQISSHGLHRILQHWVPTLFGRFCYSERSHTLNQHQIWGTEFYSFAYKPMNSGICHWWWDGSSQYSTGLVATCHWGNNFYVYEVSEICIRNIGLD